MTAMQRNAEYPTPDPSHLLSEIAYGSLLPRLTRQKTMRLKAERWQ